MAQDAHGRLRFYPYSGSHAASLRQARGRTRKLSVSALAPLASLSLEDGEQISICKIAIGAHPNEELV